MASMMKATPRQIMMILAAWGLAGAGVVAVYQWLGVPAWSLFAGVGTVVLPQILALYGAARRRKSRLNDTFGVPSDLYSLAIWYSLSRLSLTFLCLVVSMKILHTHEMLVAPYFIGGVVAGILGNVIFLYRRPPAAVANPPLCDTIPPMKTDLQSTQPPRNSRQQG